MIPKIIHYIWLGGKPLPKLVKKCIKSWRKFCPDYEIKRWDESNLDLNECQYARDAYDEKKWAFASDYFRFAILQKEGGIYLDTDVQLIKSLDTLLDQPCFMGFEKYEDTLHVNPGLILGAEKNNCFINDMLDIYKKDKFEMEDGKYETVCTKATNLLVEKYGLEIKDECQNLKDVNIYSVEYFCPIDLISKRPLYKTKNTISKHLYMGSWCEKKFDFFKPIKWITRRILGEENFKRFKNWLRGKK